MADPTPTRRRRWPKVLALLLLAVVALILAGVAALPWWLGSPAGRRWLLARAHRVLAPGRLEVASFRFSWFGPTRMTGFTIIDPQGDRVVSAARATWDRDLGHILFDRPRYGTLTLDDAVVDVERNADGSIDLYEALRPILGPNPETDLTVRITSGTFRLRSPGLARPLTAAALDLTIRHPPRRRPLTWQLRLADAPGPGAPSFEVIGRYDPWRDVPGQLPDLAVRVVGDSWPLALDVAGVVARARFAGVLDVARSEGRWDLSGDAALRDLDATGSPLRGDRLRLAQVGGRWDVGQSGGSWAIRRLDLNSPLGWIKATGPVPAPPGATTRLEGQLDLAALARRLPHALRIREGLTLERGSARLQVIAGAEAIDVEARVADLVARDGEKAVTLRDPASLSARLVGGRQDFRVERLTLKTPFLDATGRGDVDRGVTVTATLDLAGFQRQARDLIDFGDLDLAGKGRLEGDYRREKGSFTGRLVADLDGLRVAGPLSLRRESIHLDGTLRGPADGAGLPRGWGSLRLDLASGDLAAALTATAGPAAIDLDARAEAPLPRRGRVEARMAGRWADRALDIGEARFTLRPDDPAATVEGTIALSARGRFNPDSGELALDPIPGQAGRAIALAPDGLRVSGLGRERLRVQLATAGDVSALARAWAAWHGGKPLGLAGTWSGRWSAAGGDGLQFGGRVEAQDLSWPASDGRRSVGPLLLAVRGAYHDEPDRIDLAELVLASPYATLEGSGKIEDPAGRRLADLRGTLKPDWEALNALVRERVEPGARLEGTPRGFHVKGPLEAEAKGEWPLGLDAEVGLALTEADFYGMKLGPTALVALVREGRAAIAPIRTTLNGGSLRLDPEVRRGDDGDLVLRLASGAAIEGAEVNDEVSRRVLAFVAPVLDQATRVHGTISATIDRAELPLAADAGRKAVVEGRVLFQDVEFAPGPLARLLLDVVHRPEATLRLDEPVVLAIADGRVTQRGLAVPVGRLTKVELDGSVGFDRSLDLEARIPLTSAMVANNPLLGDIVEGARVRVPIRGTLSRPKFDRDAFNAGLKDLGKDLLGRTAARGAAELLMRLARPRDPDAAPPPPRMTPQERKAQRQEKRARRRQGLGP
jgi:translocation and assembly module TamB